MPRIRRIFDERLTKRAREEALKKAKPKDPKLHAEIASIGSGADFVRSSWRSVSRRFDANVSIKDELGAQRSGRQTFTMTASITGIALYWPLLRAITPVNIKHPYFTEYRLPFVIAVAPLLVLALRWKNVFG